VGRTKEEQIFSRQNKANDLSYLANRSSLKAYPHPTLLSFLLNDWMCWLKGSVESASMRSLASKLWLLVRLLSVVQAMSGACYAAGSEIRAFLTPSISRFAAK
jgi:hypothetical protein